MDTTSETLSWREKKRRIAFWFGYVYVLKCGEFYKIGYSKKPYRRARKLSTASPYPIEVIFSLRTPHYKQVEKSLHRQFRDKRRNGEWFALDDDDLLYIRSVDDVGRSPLYIAQARAYEVAWNETSSREVAYEAMVVCREQFAGGCL